MKEMNIWEQVGEKPSIYAPEKGAEIIVIIK